MKKNKIKKVNLTSSDLSVEKQAELQRILPEVFREGKIDWEKLRLVFGEKVDERMEKFNFTWNGKSKAIGNVLVPSKLTLKPMPEESIKWDDSENLFIEGDNLEVLKLLQKAYFEKVKMIYIDPPYNTGGDFVYRDNFTSPLDNYLEQTGQKGEGMSLSTNRETSGRYHSDWLSMMYPRLKLAWNLLRDDGVIFVSIDDNESHRLRMVMDEIFGEENFEGHIHWRRRHNQPNDATKMIGLVAEHILVFAKNSVVLKSRGVGKVELTGKFSNPDNDSRGDWASKPWKVGSGQSGSRYKIETPTGKEYDEDWMGEELTFMKLLADKRIVFPDKGKGAPRKKYFKFEREEEGQSATNWWNHDQFGSNQDGSNELAQILGAKDIFDNPKPTKLIKNLMSLSNIKENDLVLDFFGGSGTTAHSVMRLLNEDEINLKFIIVQLPEKLDENNKEQKKASDFCRSINKSENVAEISKERIRRVIKGYGDKPEPIDAGFKVFKLEKSNYIENDFELDPEKSDEENEKEFLAYLEKAKQQGLFEKTDDLDVVYENIVKEGFSLNSKISKEKIGKNQIYKVVDGERELRVCLEKKIAPETIKILCDKSLKGKSFICLDNALNDSSKANLALNLELKTI